MTKCTICNKDLYNATYKSYDIVCSSCSLTESKELKNRKGKVLTTKRMDEVRTGLNQIAQKIVVRVKVRPMTEILIKSNYARNRTILLSNNQTVTFDTSGHAKLPAHLLEVFTQEMNNKPGRYFIVNESAPAFVPEPVAEELTPFLVTEEDFAGNIDEVEVLSESAEEVVVLDEEYTIPEPKNSKSSKKKK